MIVLKKCKYCGRVIWPWQNRGIGAYHELCLEVWHIGWKDRARHELKPVLGGCDEVSDAE